MRPGEFRALMNRFFNAASRVVVDHDGIVDKFVGDEIVGIFVPGLAGPGHARQATDAVVELAAAALAATGLPVGAGVNTGVAFGGTVGEDVQVEFTAICDAFNVTARLASAAGAGEVLVTSSAARPAALENDGLEHRSLDLKGKTDSVEVVVVRPG